MESSSMDKEDELILTTVKKDSVRDIVLCQSDIGKSMFCVDMLQTV